MRTRELISDEPLPVADDTWWTGLTIDERRDFDLSRHYQEAWNVCYVDAGFQIAQEKALRARIETVSKSKHAAERSLAASAIALMRGGVSAPRHRADSDV